MTSASPDIWASLPMPALILGSDDRILAVNSPTEAFLNTSARALLDSLVWDKVTFGADLKDALSRARRDQATLFVNEINVGSSNRDPIDCTIQIAPVAASTSLLLLISPREIQERARQSKDASRGAKSAIGMAEMLAHEIKNPLAGITGAAQLLSMNLTPADREMTDLIVEESRRIVKLLDQVEQFGNIRPPEKRATNIHDVLDRARKSAVFGFAAHMKIIEEYDPSLPATSGDGDQLLQVFQNLLKNAAEASGADGGTLRIRTYYDHALRLKRRDGGGGAVPLQVEIIDDGPGVPEDLASGIFDPFVSGRENGTGLGLALVSKIVADHDGWVAVDSVPGRTVFRVSLPVATERTEIS